MKILQVSSSKVFPASNGGQERTEGILSNFNSEDNIIRYSVGGDISKAIMRRQSEVLLTSNNYLEFVDNHLFDQLSKSPILLGYPKGILLNILYSFRIPRNLKELISWADIIIVRGPWIVEPVAKFSENPVYYSSHNVETNRFINLREKLFGNLAYKKVEEIEKQAVENSFGIICTTKKEKEYYSNNFDIKNLILSPNGTKESILGLEKENRKKSLKKKHEVEDKFTGIFIGSDYDPNIEACRTINKMCKEELDELIHIFAVGSAGKNIKNTAENFEATGYVDDLEKYLEMADFALNPVKDGAGSNTKIFDYFGKGIPTISTEFGLRGLEVEDSSEKIALKASDSKQISKQIGRLKSNPELYQSLRQNCFKYVQDNTWKKISQELREEMQKQIERKRL